MGRPPRRVRGILKGPPAESEQSPVSHPEDRASARHPVPVPAPTMRPLLPLLPLVLASCQTNPADPAAAPDPLPEAPRTERFAFEVDGLTLVGVLDRPAGEPAATLVLVHGYGATDVVEGRWFQDLRAHFVGHGMNVLVWDKPGCGTSEGEFDINQPVAESADEVVAAVRALRESGIPGGGTVGLWGISRAGWIAPLALRDDPELAFWISISGTDDQENARYLLASNWPLEGRTKEETERLVAAWQGGFDAVWKGDTYESFLEVTAPLREDEFMRLMGWGGTPSAATFAADQAGFLSGELKADPETGLMIVVPGFAELLSSLDVPVLALFGEKDTNVDWRSTAALYRRSLGGTDLTVHVFPDANHILKRCATGGVREMQELPWDTPYAEGYFDTMTGWLVERGFARE